MAKENWGKKHICPFCGAMFYDMKKEVVVCPKCKKNLTVEDEIDFIRKKKKTEVKPVDQIEELGVNDEVVDLSESEMFFDMDNDEQAVSNTNYYSDEEDDY
ncbi:MAG: TIGR02300 family protein [Alphaproteobacteria bacterium]|nr:TIGR02300 family protein [Alphaproteobacteria bacterium]